MASVGYFFSKIYEKRSEIAVSDVIPFFHMIFINNDYQTCRNENARTIYIYLHTIYIKKHYLHLMRCQLSAMKFGLVF